MARRRHHRFVRLADRVEVASGLQATALIVAGQVTVNGVVTRNPNTMVAEDAVITFVKSRTLRGAIKLRAALTRFDARVAGRVCVDVGAAAGGFTAALLDAGARRVYAVDAGFGQLGAGCAKSPELSTSSGPTWGS